MDFGFMGGSMGAVVGEKVARAAEGALAARVPLIIVSASGGARMQEGTMALMQLAKTMAALERLRAGHVSFISVMSDPTTGGVFASYAAMGDVNLAEPNALIGFAGARVGAGTIGVELPPGFQRSEFLFSHGFVDRVVARADLRRELAAADAVHALAAGGARIPSRSGALIPFPGTTVEATIDDPLLAAVLDGRLDPTDADAVARAAGTRSPARPLIVGGAITSAAISLVGVAWVAWRASRPGGSTMSRAARDAHARRLADLAELAAGVHGGPA
jgi:hypothetical protein